MNIYVIYSKIYLFQIGGQRPCWEIFIYIQPHTQMHTPAVYPICVCWVNDVICLSRTQINFIFNKFLSFTPRMPMWGHISPHLSGGKSAKSCITSHCLIRFLLQGRKSEQIQLSQHSVFSQGEVLVEVPDSSTNCGCPQHTCRRCNESLTALRHTTDARVTIDVL